MLTKGPNYRQPRSTNFNKAFVKITTGLENCIKNLASTTKYNVNNFEQGKKMILGNSLLNTKFIETMSSSR